MDYTKEQLAAMLRVDEFPRSAKYDPEWVLQNEMGPNVLWLAEALSQKMSLEPGMRVLDMGCGTAMSSIFLAKEFDVQVWANDLWIKATDNWQRVREASVEDRVFPIHAEARSLPYAQGFFDAIVSLDSYHYYGTEDLYLQHFVKFLRPGGQIGIIVPGYLSDFGQDVPEHLRKEFHGDWHSFHTPDWWRWHFEKTRLVDVELAESLPRGWELWMKWEEVRKNDFAVLRADGGRYVGFVRMVARRREAQ